MNGVKQLIQSNRRFSAIQCRPSTQDPCPASIHSEFPHPAQCFLVAYTYKVHNGILLFKRNIIERHRIPFVTFDTEDIDIVL